MSGFERYARLICERVFGAVPPQGYIDQLMALNNAAAAWFDAHPGAAIMLKVPTFDPEEPLLTGNLDAADTIGMCGDDNTREFIRSIDERTGHTATLLMLQICVLIQNGQAFSKGVNTRGGSA